jgi:hypothetical protein
MIPALGRLTGWALVLVALAALIALVLFVGPCRERPRTPEVAPDTLSEGAATHGRPSPAGPSGLIPGATRETVTVIRQVTRTLPDTALVTRYVDLARAYARWRIEAAESAKVRAARRDTVSRETAPAPAEVLPPMALSYSGSVLTMWLTPSSGRVAKFTAHAQPHWSAVAGRGGASDQRPVVVEDRAWVRTTREIGGCALPALLSGAAAGALGAVAADEPGQGAVLGGGVGAVLGMGACLWD